MITSGVAVDDDVESPSCVAFTVVDELDDDELDEELEDELDDEELDDPSGTELVVEEVDDELGSVLDDDVGSELEDDELEDDELEEELDEEELDELEDDELDDVVGWSVPTQNKTWLMSGGSWPPLSGGCRKVPVVAAGS